MRFVLALTVLLAVATTKASTSASAVNGDDAAGRSEEELVEKDIQFRQMRGNKNKASSSKSSKDARASKESKSASTATTPSSGGGNDDSPDARTCGHFCEMKAPNFPGLQGCLRDQLPGKTTYRGEQNVPKVILSDDDHYDFARHNCFGSRFPAAVVLAGNADGLTNESTIDDVQKALRCARDNGYKVSGRGKSHSYHNWGAMDGFVVIDMANTCAVLDVDRTQQGDHIIDGSMYIATVKYGAGCNNAFVVQSLAAFDDSEGAMGLTGSCPSVGVVGFLMGGGWGDITPYVGQAVDVVHEVEMIDYEGNLLTASETENQDLFWALRGGGGALGIVVSITYKVVESPLPPSKNPKDRRFTYVDFSATDQEKAGEMVYELQEFLTGAPKEISSKFGGSPSLSYLIYLGDQEQMKEELHAYAPKFLKTISYDIPFVTPSYSDMAMFLYCKSLHYPVYVRPQLRNFTYEGAEYQGIDICQELEIDGSNCEMKMNMGLHSLFPTDCANPKVLAAMKAKAADPQSFLNNYGPHPTVSQAVFGLPVFPVQFAEWDIPGYYQRRLSKQTWDKILRQDPNYVLQLAHGAQTLVGSKDTAFPHRYDDMWVMTDGQSSSAPGFHAYLEEELGNDPSKLLGFYNAMGSERFPGWQKIYFGDNYERLQRIKAKYDPTELFTKPMTPETPHP